MKRYTILIASYDTGRTKTFEVRGALLALGGAAAAALFAGLLVGLAGGMAGSVELARGWLRQVARGTPAVEVAKPDSAEAGAGGSLGALPRTSDEAGLVAAVGALRSVLRSNAPAHPATPGAGALRPPPQRPLAARADSTADHPRRDSASPDTAPSARTRDSLRAVSSLDSAHRDSTRDSTP